MNLLNNILSSIDPAAANQFSAQAGKQIATNSTPRPVQRPVPNTNGTPQPPPKRKAEGQPGGGQNKIQRKDVPAQVDRANVPARPAPTPGITKPKVPTPSNAVPYRGTAGNGGQGAGRVTNTTVSKPNPVARTPGVFAKPALPLPKAAGAPVPTKKGSYAAMLQRASQVQQAKPAAPPVKHEVTKILTKKERDALKAKESAAAKGKKPNLAGSGRYAGTKPELKEKRRPADLGYQGTARPAKKPVEIGYKGTARPANNITGAAGKAGGPAAAKAKSKVGQGRYGGYASWSDEELDEEEDDYDSDASSDMEGGLWDVENEEQVALKVAKKEDAQALKEENELKRQKEERRLKLAAMNKAAASKKKF
ncbi:hypothetical protein K505DRAFT_329144 [Melanomma pulvis-pyrius CBS 109.77]|uniref:SPT2-domain-containing protein n=1 Tax=Melanomma pulvis-pyrius CBS 109.77 TaxID=1314802 RepID=A0A6A6WW38_9PLEO|nr:hypothetical protein K505DRAFT_329144 [Melanomma pulvis-pyrius CBS 109.77]